MAKLPLSTTPIPLFVVLVVILTLGLWPFHVPRNQVAWLSGRDGLVFGGYGSALSAAAFSFNSSSGSLELWLEPASLKDQHTILAFEGTDALSPMSIRQDGRSLIVRRQVLNSKGETRSAVAAIRSVFQRDVPVRVTINLGAHETAAYVNGVAAGTQSFEDDATPPFTGRLLLGNSPTTGHGWPGQILGLAVCDRKLTLSEVERRDKLWQVGQASSASDAGLLALYPFDEHSGSIAHNRIDSTTNLTIPSRFFVLHPRFLTPPWREYRHGLQYWQDVSTNIIGFIPLGLVAYCYFSGRRTARPAAIALAVGFLTSLSIELLQGALPTRTSGTTDILTNTLGTGIGILLCRSFSTFREGPIGGSDGRA